MSQTNTSLLDEVVQWSQETCRQELKSVLPKLTISSLMFVVSSKFQRCKLMVHSVTCLHYNTGKITKNNNPVAEMIKIGRSALYWKSPCNAFFPLNCVHSLHCQSDSWDDHIREFPNYTLNNYKLWYDLLFKYNMTPLQVY